VKRTPPDGYVPIGRLGRSFKVAGGVRLWLDSPAAEQSLDSFERLFVTGLGDTRLRSHESVSGSLVVYLEGVRDRTVARSLVNAEVWADASGLPADTLQALEEPADEDLLIGAAVYLDGRAIGTVVEANLSGENDFVEVQLEDERLVLVPLVAPYVSLDADGIHLSDPPPGLLDGSPS